MDEALRTLEQRLRAAPRDAGLLRALVAARERAGDARGAWRARARLARVTDAVEDWRALEPEARVPRVPRVERSQVVPREVLGVQDDAVLARTGEALVGLTSAGDERWRVLVGDDLALPCGPDVLVAGRWDLRLVDAEGVVVASAPITAGARKERPAGFSSSAALTGDRLVLRHWTNAGYGARTVIDVGEAFGSILAHVPLEGRRFSDEGHARVASGRLLLPAWNPANVSCLPAVDAADAVWTARDEQLLAVDPRGAVTHRAAHGETLERDLRTGQRRWSSRTGDRRPWLPALGPAHAVLVGERLDAVQRADGELAWSVPVDDARAGWVLGDDLVVVGGTDDQVSLSARSLTTGAERWRAPLPGAWVRQREGVPTLRASVVGDDRTLVVRIGDHDDWNGRWTTQFVITEAS